MTDGMAGGIRAIADAIPLDRPAILILSERGGVFTGIGEFIRRGKRVPREARVA
jgi:hypothetical protein